MGEQKPAKKQKSSQVFLEGLKEIFDFKFFYDDFNDVCVHFKNKDNFETHRIVGESFVNFLLDAAYTFIKSSITKEQIKKEVISHLPPAFDQPYQSLSTINLSLRVGNNNNKIYYDIHNPSWDIIEVDETGWRKVKQEKPIFRRNNGQKEQCYPIDENNLEKIFDFLNIREEDQLIFLVNLITYFVPDIPHPIMMFTGKPGVSKTTSCSLVKQLVDPTVVNTQKLPKEDKDLIVSWSSQYVLFYDNVTTLSQDMSNTFCRGVTGEGSVNRKLFSDNDLVFYNLKRCFLINGIDQPGTKADLMQRTILIELDPIPEEKRKTEELLFSEFNKLKPQFLGSIFNCISRAMTIKKTLSIDKLPRLADFAIWGEAISLALGHKPNEFLDKFRDKQQQQEKELVKYDALFNVFEHLLSAELPVIEGTASEILNLIRADHEITYEEKKYIPQSAGSMGKKIKEMTTLYGQQNMMIESRMKDGSIIYKIYKKAIATNEL